MKKNRMMRVASCLLVLVLLTTCVISGTFAKYTTFDDAQDSAKVAKWGITLTVEGDDVLYDDAKSGDEVTGLKVNAKDLAAPGTYQKLATVKLTGQPEVAYSITVVVSLELEYWKVEANEYCPLVFTVKGESYYIGKDGIATVDELEEAIEDAIAKVIAGDAAADTTDGTYVVEYLATSNVAPAVPVTANDVLVDWTWAFAEGTYQTNAKDTALGNNAAKGTPATIDFSLAVTVDQID